MCEAPTPGHCPGATSSEVSAPTQDAAGPSAHDIASVVTHCARIPGLYSARIIHTCHMFATSFPEPRHNVLHQKSLPFVRRG